MVSRDIADRATLSLRSSTWQSDSRSLQNNVSHSRKKIPSLAALNFCLAFGSSGLSVWESEDLKLNPNRPRKAGHGGFAVVEIGKTPEKRPIVVKKSLRLDRPNFAHQSDEFTKHFNQLCLELRILTHSPIRNHANIVDILGVCAEDYSGEPSLSLVLEYAPFGTLETFFTNAQAGDHNEIMRCALQVANGFEVLHSSRICHGDVKTRNVLVFLEEGKWVYKVSDFGNSVVSAVADDIEGEVSIPPGTPLYNAPEIRSASFGGNSTFTIADALLTDVFSFGLLAWEILRRGKSFYEKSWDTGQAEGLELQDRVDVLGRLSHNELLNRGLAFVTDQDLPSGVKECFAFVLQGTLQDSPKDRSTMRILAMRLSDALELNSADQETHQKSTQHEPLLGWTGEYTLYEILDLYVQNGISYLIDREPFKTIIQQMAFSELTDIVASPTTPQSMRAHAAFTICECITVHFGSASWDDILPWLKQAILHGSYKAKQWFPRICYVFGVLSWMEDQTGPSVQIEKGLMEQSSECYLSERIRQYGYIGWKFEAFQDHTKPRTLSKLLGSISPDSICNSSDSGFTQQLLLAAFTGNNPDLLKLLENYQSEIVSADGFTPVHLACIGGHLSTLKVLLEAGFSASKVACHGITALHLAIFFDDLDTTLAVNLLLKHGANPTLETTCNVVWDDHDCKLFGTPLDWAISTRNLKLVKVLLPKTPHSNGARIRSAISHFFWDIASEILNNSPEEKSGVKKTNCFTTLARPFRHWIIHGKDRFNSIDRTLQICKEHDVDICVGLPKGSTTLMVLIEKARMEEDFYLIERLISVMESAEIKKYNNDGASALILAIIRATNTPHWKKILQALVLHYTVTELQEERLYGGSHLHMAVRTDSPVAARILLDIGVDPNQRTFDSDNITPLHICVIKAGSLEMCRVLVEYGADMNLKEHGTMATPLVHLARKIRPGNSILIDYILELDFPEIVYTDLLDETVHNFWVVPRTQHLGSRELLRHLLTIPKVARHVDDLNMEGSTTLLQTCAYQLCLEALELLLEAGADVNKGIPYRRGIFYPLQIACIMGRAYFLDSDDNPGPANIAAKEEKADRAIQIGLRLLERHHARMDDPFSGITELHIASYVGLKRKIQMSQGETSATSKRGLWPSVKGDFTPASLVQKAVKKDLGIVFGLRNRLGRPKMSKTPPRGILEYGFLKLIGAD